VYHLRSPRQVNLDAENREKSLRVLFIALLMIHPMTTLGLILYAHRLTILGRGEN
jgi:hypothetical protein